MIGESQQAKNLMIWVGDTIGQVFRVYPEKARSDILQVFDPITGYYLSDQHISSCPQLSQNVRTDFFQIYTNCSDIQKFSSFELRNDLCKSS